MLAGSQISPTIDTSFICSLCPNQITKIALIKLTDTKKKKEKRKLGGKKTPTAVKLRRKANKIEKRCEMEKWKIARNSG